MRQKVPFKVHAGEPTIIEVKSANGKSWELKVVLAIFDVNETGVRPDDGLPQFDVRANVAVDTTEKVDAPGSTQH